MLPCDSVPLAMDPTTTEQRGNGSPATQTQDTSDNLKERDVKTSSVVEPEAIVIELDVVKDNDEVKVLQLVEEKEDKSVPEIGDSKSEENVPNGRIEAQANTSSDNAEKETKPNLNTSDISNAEILPELEILVEPERIISPVKQEILLASPAKTAKEKGSELSPTIPEPVFGSKDPNPYEDDGAISVSSSPGLQIQLDDDEESSPAKNHEEMMEETSNNSLPMIASVMSLSQHSDEMAKDSSGEPRRATLKLKRGIEISFPVDNEGQPLASSETEREPPVKKAKPDMNVKDMDESMQKLQKDIRTLSFLAHQKEKEWNYLIRLQKMKEEMLVRLKRNREVLMIKQQTSQELRVKTMALAHPPPYAEPPPPYSSKIPTNQVIPFVQDILAKYVSQANTKTQSTNSVLRSTPSTSSASISSSMSGSNSIKQRPILPKPQNTATAHLAQALSSYPFAAMAAAANQNQTLGNHDDNSNDRINKQFVSVKSLIADYKAKHPEEIPPRGRRLHQQQQPPRPLGAAPNLNSNLSRPASTEPSPRLPMNLSMSMGAHSAPVQPDPGMNVSFKDVLLQFAKLSRDGAHNGSAVQSSATAAAVAAAKAGGGGGGTSGSGASILQSALSGSFSQKEHGSGPPLPKTANYAPTLAQLLTSTSEHSATTCTTTAATAQTPAELTLSNLLATSKDAQRPMSSSSRNATSSTTPGSNPSSTAATVSPSATDIPQCQGCQSKTAQFVCAGCGSQWYCSRECQVAAWEEHSEHCLG